VAEKILLKTTMEAPEGTQFPEAAQEILQQVVDPEIERFGAYFAERAGGGPLAGYEKEVLRAYLWFKLKEES